MTYLSPDNALWHPTPAPAPTGSEQPQDPTASAPAASTSVPSSDEVARPSPLQLPSGLALALADVDTGSNTPSLVGKVLAWRKAKPEWGASFIFSFFATCASKVRSIPN